MDSVLSVYYGTHVKHQTFPNQYYEARLSRCARFSLIAHNFMLNFENRAESSVDRLVLSRYLATLGASCSSNDKVMTAMRDWARYVADEARVCNACM